MAGDRLDQELSNLDDALQRVQANLLELELDSDRRFIDASSLQGESAARLQAADDAIAECWQHHRLLTELLERARALRKRGWLAAGHEQELTELLEGRSIVLEGSEVPLAERHLLGDSRVKLQLTPAQLLERMAASFDEAKAVFAQVAAATRSSVPALRAAQDRIAQAIRLADRLGVRSRPDLHAAEAKLAPLADRVVHDPLSVDPAEIDAVARSVEQIGTELTGIVALSEEIVGRLDEAREQLTALRDLAGEGAQAHEALRARIADRHTPEPLVVGTELDRQLDRIGQLAQEGDWPAAHDELERFTDSLQALSERARAIVAANREPIETRNRLRAMLDAYQVKAGRLGLVEDADAAELFARAREELYRAPTDLDAATELVRRYQQRILAKEVPR
jgi:hypothetical protein